MEESVKKVLCISTILQFQKFKSKANINEVWIFNGRIVDKKINHLHERALQIADKDYLGSFENLLAREKSFTIFHRNIQSLAI